MNAPNSMEEYVARFQANQRIFGAGIQVSMSVPCPFCAAPDFMVYRVLNVERAMHEGSCCKECGRSMRALIQADDKGNVRYEFVQVGGPDQPEWLQPKMRRLESDAPKS